MQRRSRHGGFTLIELLVVVGVISVLVALLLPALNRARDQARQVDCMSRLRQSALVVIGMYGADYKGAFLPILAPRAEYYDLEKDPYEMKNIAADPAVAKEREAVKKELRKLTAEALGI